MSDINFSEILAILTITISVNIGIFAIFYTTLFKKAQKLLQHDRDIAYNRMIILKTLDQQTHCLEQLSVRFCDVENMVERLAFNIDSQKHNIIKRYREIILNKNFALEKNISELKIFGEDEQYRLSAFRSLLSTGDINTLDLIALKIKTEKDKRNRTLYKKYAKILKNNINTILNRDN